MLIPHTIIKQLQDLTEAKRFLIAYSGGLDSHVLLHLLSQSPQNLVQFRAMHVHHGLQEGADQWLEHCKKTCKLLNVPFVSEKVKIKRHTGQSIEDQSRIARYEALFENLKPDEVLLTAHHQSDQAETLLLQLFRGAGVNGLASMPLLKTLNHGDEEIYHARPLLLQSFESLKHYASEHELFYIEDPSNFDNTFDRNYLRNSVLPSLRERWPSIDKTLSRVASIQSQTKEILDKVAENNIDQISENNSEISIEKLLGYSKEEQILLIRFWINQQGFKAPSELKLQKLFSDVINAKSDAKPLLEWSDTQIRRFKGKLFIMESLPKHDEKQIQYWNGESSLYISSIDKTLHPQDLTRKSDDISIRFRQGGEKIYSNKRGRSISLKNLFQELEVPPWVRPRIPLVYEDEKLVQIIGMEEFL